MTGLRERALRGSASEFGVTPRGEIWGVLMELGFENGAATLVSISDGTSSLYYSTGGGVIGAGSHPDVKAASQRLCDLAAEPARAAAPADDFPLPADHRVRFYFLTTSGVRTAETGDAELGAGRHPLSGVFVAGHDVITAIRLHTPER